MENKVVENKSAMGELFVPRQESKKIEIVDKDFVDVLKMFAPGTSLRSALEDLLSSGMGALIVIDNGKIFSVVEKGFRIYSRFTSQKLVELAKMDGAIVLSRNIKKILYANAFLFPNQEIFTKETGTRHKAAERMAKQTGAIVLAVSERKKRISVYYGNIKYELNETSEILRRATENLQILEKQKESLNDALNTLNILEIERGVTINDVCIVIQKFEIIKRISDIVRRYLVELGKEGIVVSMRLRDLIRGVEKEQELLMKDYFSSSISFVEEILEKMDFDFLLDPLNISRMLFEESGDKKVSPKGLRILSKTNILERHIDSLIANFQVLDKMLLASEDELYKIFQGEGMISFFKEEMYGLREKFNLRGRGV